MSSTAQPAFPQPLRVWSPNMSKRHRNHTMIAAIQMKNQKDQSSTSPKLLVIASMARPSRSEPARSWSDSAIFRTWNVGKPDIGSLHPDRVRSADGRAPYGRRGLGTSTSGYGVRSGAAERVERSWEATRGPRLRWQPVTGPEWGDDMDLFDIDDSQH